jgi:hypothetical protein
MVEGLLERLVGNVEKLASRIERLEHQTPFSLEGKEKLTKK